MEFTFNTISPESKVILPTTQFKSVVFPQPLGPRKPYLQNQGQFIKKINIALFCKIKKIIIIKLHCSLLNSHVKPSENDGLTTVPLIGIPDNDCIVGYLQLHGHLLLINIFLLKKRNVFLEQMIDK